MLPISVTADAESRHSLSSTMPTSYTTAGHVPPNIRRVLSAFVFTALTVTVSAASPPTIPYIPTTILFPGSSPLGQSSVNVLNSKAYIFSPNADSSAIELLSLDLLNSVKGDSHPQPVPAGSDKPPFLTDNKHTTFTPSILDNGNIIVIAGSDACSNSQNAATLYTYSSTVSSSASSPATSGTWSSHPITASSPNSWDATESLNPYFLTTAIQFTSQLEPSRSPPIFYLYGGMCPFPNASSSSWQSSATYSNKMLRISSSSSSSDSSKKDTYTLDLAASAGGPPVAEAGFTFTPLSPPSIANRSGIVTQQMSYVMLGGHTQSAFVNMSTAAVWSLPEETWSFVAIREAVAAGAGEGGKVDLTIKDTIPAAAAAGTRGVDSRSGHTAVLSEDGSRLVILGGWVGGFDRAAEPQLVVVEIGPSFEEWRWSIPDVEINKSGSKGVYGHGAALLPGNVMVVYGGYDIPDAAAASSRKARKRQVSSEGVRFFNVTSLEWQDEYAHPSSSSGGGGGGDSNSGDSNSNSSNNNNKDNSTTSSSSPKHLGLGLGLGLGIPILLAILIALICLRRRQLRRRAERDDALRGLAQGMPAGGAHSHSYGDDDEMSERNDPNSGIGFFPWNASTAHEWYTGGLDPYGSTGTGTGRRSLGYETLRGGGAKGRSGSASGSGLYVPPLPPAPLMTASFFGGGGGGGGGGSSSTGRPRGSVARGLYQPTTGVGDFGASPTRSGKNRIHPIYEEIEDDDLEDVGGKHALSPDLDFADEKDDPFLTPTKEGFGGVGLFPPPAGGASQGGSGSSSSGSSAPGSRGSGSSSPEMVQVTPAAVVMSPKQAHHQQQDPEVQGWVSDVDAADAVLTARISRHGSTTTMPPALKLAGSSVSPGGGPTTPTRQSQGRLSPTRRTSTRSAGGGRTANADFDDARTGSNLSDRSAFSFVQGGERAHLRTTFGGSVSGPGTTPGAGGIGRSGSSSGSSAHTYSTAKSNFATMQAEGPSLLLGGGSSSRGYGGQDTSYPRDQHPEEQLEEEDYYIPGSPSKSKPRRSWLGSLRRVFSGATPSGSPGSSSRGESPTHDGLLDGDSSSRLVGMGPGGRLLRRKQGREAWGADQGQGGQGEHGHDEDDEWDVEKAVEQRLVQIMFTVPKERLRVVNAEIEKEEEAVVVDPDRDSYQDSVVVEEEGYDEKEKGKMVEGTSVHPEPEPEPEPLSPRLIPVPESRSGSGSQAQAQPQVHDENKTAQPKAEAEAEAEIKPTTEDKDLLAVHDQPQAAPSSASHKGGISPSTSMRSTSNNTSTLHTAEAIRLERPRTRVLEMVETIECKSRENSPSPTR